MCSLLRVAAIKFDIVIYLCLPASNLVFFFCINYSRGVVASLDGIIGSLIQTSLPRACDSRSGTSDIQAIIS